MNGPEHYKEAEAHIDMARGAATFELATSHLATAQVHATLALVAASITEDSHISWAADFWQ